MHQNTLSVVQTEAKSAAEPERDEPSAVQGRALRQMLRPVAAYLTDEDVREITIPRPGTIFLRIRGGWHERPAPELTYTYLKALTATMASFNNVDFSPIMSLKLLDGERGQILLPPAVLEGSISLNIRKFSSVVKDLDELASEGAFTGWKDVSGQIQNPSTLTSDDQELLALLTARDMRAFLERAVLLRKNIIISGKTGSGKTTFARSLIERVPTDERLITIEDVHELFLPNHSNRVHMMYGAEKGQVSATDCVAACMRSSPDRIFLSELRHAEAAWEYLTALNTGHPGSITTTHSNSSRESFNRVGLLIKQSKAGNAMDIETIRNYLYSTLDVSLHFSDFKLVEVYFNPERAAALT